MSFSYTTNVAPGSAVDSKACNSIAVASDQTLASEPFPVCATTAEADLSVSLPADVALQPGRSGVLPFTIGNAGASATAPAEAMLDIPAGLTVTSFSPAGWLCTSGDATAAPAAGPLTLSCAPVETAGSPRTIDDGASDSLTLPVTTTKTSGSVTVDGDVTGSYYDPATGNDHVERTIVLAAATTGLTVTRSDGVAADVTLDLHGSDLTIATPATGEAAIGVPVGARLTIIDSIGGGALTLGGGGAAGLGGDSDSSPDKPRNAGTIVIRGATVSTTGGGNGSAGIGGGSDGKGGTVTIDSGSVVTAVGKRFAAGIGGGLAASDGSVTINGGRVDATGPTTGIGSGAGPRPAGTITLAERAFGTPAVAGGTGACGTGAVAGVRPGRVDARPARRADRPARRRRRPDQPIACRCRSERSGARRRRSGQAGSRAGDHLVRPAGRQGRRGIRIPHTASPPPEPGRSDSV